MHSTCALAMQYTLKYIKDILILLSTDKFFLQVQLVTNWRQLVTKINHLLKSTITGIFLKVT